MKRRTLLSLPMCSTLTSPALADARPGRQQAMQWPDIAYGRLWLAEPEGEAPARGWPLLVFLHGSGERGSDLEAVKRHGPPRWPDEGRALPLILASPQLPEEQRWNPESLHQLLMALKARLHIDPDRCLATGLSLGGHGVWHWATRYPEELAAVAPVCGFGEATEVAAMRRVAVRAYHGDKDDVVPLAPHQACIEAHRAAGGRASLTVYPGVGHDAWTPAYQDPELLPWLLAQRRGAA